MKFLGQVVPVILMMFMSEACSATAVRQHGHGSVSGVLSRRSPPKTSHSSGDNLRTSSPQTQSKPQDSTRNRRKPPMPSLSNAADKTLASAAKGLQELAGVRPKTSGGSQSTRPDFKFSPSISTGADSRKRLGSPALGSSATAPKKPKVESSPPRSQTIKLMPATSHPRRRMTKKKAYTSSLSLNSWLKPSEKESASSKLRGTDDLEAALWAHETL